MIIGVSDRVDSLHSLRLHLAMTYQLIYPTWNKSSVDSPNTYVEEARNPARLSVYYATEVCFTTPSPFEALKSARHRIPSAFSSSANRISRNRCLLESASLLSFVIQLILH